MKTHKMFLNVDKIEEAWTKIIRDVPIKVIKELAAAVHQTYGTKKIFYEIRPYPIHVAAACNFSMSCKYLIDSEILYGYDRDSNE